MLVVYSTLLIVKGQISGRSGESIRSYAWILCVCGVCVCVGGDKGE